MNKSEIVGRVAGRMGLSKPAAEGAVDTVLTAIGEALAKGEDVRIAGFGTFATRTRRARTGRNPRTGESVSIPASKTPSFKAGKALKETVNRGWESTAGERGDDERPRRERIVVQSVARDALRARGSRRRGPGEAGVRLDLSDWPGGVAPVWAMLDPESAQALRDEPSEGNRALRLASDLTEEEFGQSAFVRNALVLLEGMAVRDGCGSRTRATSSERRWRRCALRCSGRGWRPRSNSGRTRLCGRRMWGSSISCIGWHTWRGWSKGTPRCFG